MIDLTKFTRKAKEALVLKNVELLETATAVEIYDKIQTENIAGFSYVQLCKLLTELVERNLLAKQLNGPTYTITQTGKDMKRNLNREIHELSLLLNKEIEENNEKKEIQITPEKTFNFPGIKTIPYTVQKFDNENEDRFFKELEKTLIYPFEGRGLGQGNYENYLLAFQNNKQIKFIAEVKSYDQEKKEIKIKKNTVKKLNPPISNSEMSCIRTGFQLCRTKQTISKKEEIETFLHILRKH